ncbi:MAG: DUF3943 domain-containing protein [Gemmatimonadota bacterium]
MHALRRIRLIASLLALGAPIPLMGQTVLSKGQRVPLMGPAADRSAVRAPDELKSPTIWVGGLTTHDPSRFDYRGLADTSQQNEFCCDQRHLGLVLVEVGTAMVIPWYFNRFASDDSTAVLSLESWGRNIREGFEWDHDNFKTNMFAHPIHGNLYFNAGRSNGYNFWESAAWAWGGSFMWELFGENNRPAINDWIATAVGGIAIGEIFHRTSRTIWDNSATGTERALREIGGFIINPMGGASRLFRGEMVKVGENPEDRYPGSVQSYLRGGWRYVSEGGGADASNGSTFQFGFGYGDPFEEYEKPFEAFELDASVYGKNEDSSLGFVRIRAGLWGTEVAETSSAKHVFRIEQLFSYVNNRTIITGGSAVGASFNSRWGLSDKWKLETRVAPGALLLWGTSSEYSDFTKREYDFGTGFGFVTGAFLKRDGRPVLGVDYSVTHQFTLNGAAGTHTNHLLFFNGNLPLFAGFGVGADYRYYVRVSKYRDFPDVNRKHSEVSGYVTWTLR